MKPSELLKQKGWCQEVYAQDANGERTNINSPTAVSFCLVGAVKYCYEASDPSHMVEVFDKLTAVLHQSIIDKDNILNFLLAPSTWNDNPWRTKEEVITLLEQIGE